MALTLAQVAATETDQVRLGINEMFREESTVFDRIPLEPIEGNAYSYNEEDALPGTGFRTVNEAYVESTGVVNQKTENIVILGGDSDVDRFLVQTSQNTLGDLRATYDRMKVKSAVATYVDSFFNGDVNVNPKGFDGLRKRLIGEQVIDSTATTASEAFLDDLDILFGQVEGGVPDAVYAPTKIIARLKSLGRKVGGAEYIMSEISGKREFTWNGVPFLPAGNHWNGREILGYDNAAGGDVYAIKFATSIPGNPGVIGLTNGGLQAYDLGELQEKPAYRTRIEFYTGLAAQGGKAAARLRGVKIA